MSRVRCTSSKTCRVLHAPPCAPARAPVYGLIHNPPPCAVLEALWVTAEEFHHISPGSVSSLWGSWCKEKHIGAEVEAEALGEAVPGEAEACHSSGNPQCTGPFQAACSAVSGRVGRPPPRDKISTCGPASDMNAST
jgi:hypothetical protein